MEMLETKNGLAIDMKVGLPHGIHARPAAKIARVAREFTAAIQLIGEYGEVNAKSMLDILSLALSHGDDIRLEACGADAREALMRLYPLLLDLDGEQNGAAAS